MSEKIERVFGSSPPMNYLLYSLNPSKMIGLNFAAKNPNNGASEAYLNKRFLSLPIVGSFHCGGDGIDTSHIMQYDPQLVLLWEDDMMVEEIKTAMKKTNTKTISISFKKMEDIPQAYRVAGEAVQEVARANLLADYSQKIIDELKQMVPSTPSVRYYYAQGSDGLATECDQSFHVEALNFAGGINVHKGEQSGLLGLENISFETLVAYDPDVIVVQHPKVFEKIIKEERWKSLRAVQNGRIHFVPLDPFNWLDRPPSFMRILGVQWLARIFYPEVYNIDMKQRMQEFYKMFLYVDLSDAQIKQIIEPA